MDYLESKPLYDTMNKKNFSDTMMEILKMLSEDDFSFVILKFQEEYSNVELANYFHLTIEEVEEREIRILSLLKGNQNIQKIKKIKF